MKDDLKLYWEAEDYKADMEKHVCTKVEWKNMSAFCEFGGPYSEHIAIAIPTEDWKGQYIPGYLYDLHFHSTKNDYYKTKT